MRHRVITCEQNVIIIETETDIIVTTDVIQPGGAFELVGQELVVPEQGHERCIIGNFTFLGIDRIFAKVLCHFYRRHDGFGDEQYSRGRDLTAVFH